MTEILAVTQADIDAAMAEREAIVRHWRGIHPNDHWTGVTDTNCPLAQALKRQVPAANDWRVSADCLLAGACRSSNYCRARTSDAMRQFMRKWDRQWNAAPHRFRVEWE